MEKKSEFLEITVTFQIKKTLTWLPCLFDHHSPPFSQQLISTEHCFPGVHMSEF